MARVLAPRAMRPRIPPNTFARSDWFSAKNAPRVPAGSPFSAMSFSSQQARAVEPKAGPGGVSAGPWATHCVCIAVELPASCRHSAQVRVATAAGKPSFAAAVGGESPPTEKPTTKVSMGFMEPVTSVRRRVAVRLGR